MPKDFHLETAMQQLEELEAYFQKPTFNLEEAIKKHKEALDLAKEITGYLHKAEQSLERLNINEVLRES